jgi:hypothetical protein
MAVARHDLEMLEEYLDDALEPGEVEALRARLAEDEGLVAALGDVGAERSARQAFYQSLEPVDGAVDALVARIRFDVTREHRPNRFLRPARYAVAAAACLAIGFFTRGWLDQRTAVPTDRGSVVAKNGVDLQAVAAYQVTLRDEVGRVVAVQRFESLEKAQEFAADLARWQSRSERLAGGHFVMTADRF